jgi:hypothetical protein
MAIIVAFASTQDAFPCKQRFSTVYPFNLPCLAIALHAGIHIDSISIHHYIVARIASPILCEPPQVLAINTGNKVRRRETHQGQKSGALRIL